MSQIEQFNFFLLGIIIISDLNLKPFVCKQIIDI